MCHCFFPEHTNFDSDLYIEEKIPTKTRDTPYITRKPDTNLQLGGGAITVSISIHFVLMCTILSLLWSAG